MKQSISERIHALRMWFKPNIQAFIISSTDPHLSEYVAPHWKSREWISGFTGSAGTVVITEKKPDFGLTQDIFYRQQSNCREAVSIYTKRCYRKLQVSQNSFPTSYSRANP